MKYALSDVFKLNKWTVDQSGSLYNLKATFVLFILFIVLVCKFQKRRKKLPPGPVALPVLGNILSIASNDVLKSLESLRQRYGDIYRIYIGNELVIVLNGHEIIHDALVKRGSHFVNRPPSAFQKITEQTTGVLYNNGTAWKEQRSFLQRTLQTICLKQSAANIEQIIQEEVSELIKAIETYTGEFDISDFIHHLGMNVMFQVTYNKRFHFGDKKAVGFATNMNAIAQQVAKMQILSNCFPFLQNMPGDLLGNKRRLYLKEELQSFCRDLLKGSNEDIDNHNAGSQERPSVAMAFDAEVEQKQSSGIKSEETSFQEKYREETMTDLIGAGGDTTATAIMWAIVHLVREPHVQDRLYTEILEVIGVDREPTLEDRKKMPYAQAVILESLRCTTTAPLLLPHSVQEETCFRGYVIPKDATVISNVTTALNDPKVWLNPHEFDPERFLSSDQTEALVPKEFVPFSLGPRACIGETMAKMELFLVVVGLVQIFELRGVNERERPGNKGTLGITYRPKPFNLRLSKRR